MRLLLLPLILLAVLAPSLFIKQGELKPSALRQEAPALIGSWASYPFPASKEEREVLASDTIFLKSFYISPSGSDARKHLKLQCSMVFSGHDVNNSIHEPEICLPAQGHFNMQSSSRLLEMPLREVSLPIQRIRSQVSYNTEQLKGAGTVNALTYYFYVGHSTITSTHAERSKQDLKDRLLKGYDQQWAFIILTIPFGEHPDARISRLTEEQADNILSDFCRDIADRSINWQMIDSIIH